jgi:hypothetical protein
VAAAPFNTAAEAAVCLRCAWPSPDPQGRAQTVDPWYAPRQICHERERGRPMASGQWRVGDGGRAVTIKCPSGCSAVRRGGLLTTAWAGSVCSINTASSSRSSCFHVHEKKHHSNKVHGCASILLPTLPRRKSQPWSIHEECSPPPWPPLSELLMGGKSF